MRAVPPARAPGLPQLPASLTALHLHDRVFTPWRAIPDVCQAYLGRLTQLSLLDLAAENVKFTLPAPTTRAAGPRQLRLASARLDMCFPPREVPASDTQCPLASRKSQLLECLSTLLAGTARVTLVSCNPWHNVHIVLRAVNEVTPCWLTFVSVADLADALRAHAFEHGVNMRLAAEGKELVFERIDAELEPAV